MNEYNFGKHSLGCEKAGYDRVAGQVSGDNVGTDTWLGLTVGTLVDVNDILLLPIEYEGDGVTWESTISGIVKTESVGTSGVDEETVELSIICIVSTSWLEEVSWLSTTSNVEVKARVGFGKPVSLTGVFIDGSTEGTVDGVSWLLPLVLKI